MSCFRGFSGKKNVMLSLSKHLYRFVGPIGLLPR